jgi:ribose 5-phosphate isomerase B
MRPKTTIPSGIPKRPPLRSGYSDSQTGTSALLMRIAIASDHAALELKAALIAYLSEAGHEVTDLGPYDGASVDYPDYGYKLAEVVASGAAERGVALCGSGIGISVAVNRNPACRCALVSEPLSAKLSREHNDANVIAMGARLTGVDMAKACLDTFLSTPFGGDRHTARVDKLSNPQIAKVPA